MAVVTGLVSYGLMSFMMTAAPLAMIGCGHPVGAAALGIQWHILAMFGPSFFTGRLITRFGKERVTATGLVLIALSAIIGLSGITIAHFWIALVLLGHRLELRLHRRDRPGDRLLPAGRARQGPGGQRLPDLRFGRHGLVLLREAPECGRLG